MQWNRVQRELGSARLRGPDALGRPSEPELDNASEGRAYLFTPRDTIDIRSTALSACTPEHLSAQFGRHHAIGWSNKSGSLVSRQVLDSVDATEGPRTSAENRAPAWIDDKELK